MAMIKVFLQLALFIALISLMVGLGNKYGYLDKEGLIAGFEQLKEKLGVWAIPAYVGAHTLTLSLCLPYAVFFEAGASLLFGFVPGVLCVFTAKLLGASLSFWIGRLVFRSSKSAMDWAQSNRYFNILVRGVEKDGWRFVLLARFSPLPSYVINYALAATQVSFFVDFLLPTVIGCLPMILQNTSIGSLAGLALAPGADSGKSSLFSYLFPMLGIGSSILISLRIKKYSTGFVMAEEELKKKE
ncbi:SNARE associated Golgi protein family [Carex rostrata]